MFLIVQKNTAYVIYIFLIVSSKNVIAQTETDTLGEAVGIASETLDAFLYMFKGCVGSPMASQRFKIDDVKGFINSPARTTVGSSPRITNNRKFFANVIATREFKDMLENDVDAIRGNFIKKMKYCDSVVMNQQLLKDFYDREVDQTKM